MLGSAAAEPGKTPDEAGKRGVFPTAKQESRTDSTGQQAQHTQQTHTYTNTNTGVTSRPFAVPSSTASMTTNHLLTIARTDTSTLWWRAKGPRKGGSTNGESPVRRKHDMDTFIIQENEF